MSGSSSPEAARRAVVVTAVHGRHDHLRRQRAALASSDRSPAKHVVVAMEDPDLSAQLMEDGASRGEAGLPTQVLTIPRSAGRLPLAAARNLGAGQGLESLTDAEDLLIFLDVDCIPDSGLIDAYLHASQRRPDDLLCGPVAYLPELPSTTLDAASTAQLAEMAAPHPARPAPEPGDILSGGEHALFWSLSFAVRADVWDRIGGFDEAYTGYGAEDTDFSWRARSRGVELSWVGGARAYHQHHPVSRPPVEHLSDILRNGRIFADRWGHWPMEGWLQEFEQRGLVRRDGDDWVATVQHARAAGRNATERTA